MHDAWNLCSSSIRRFLSDIFVIHSEVFTHNITQAYFQQKCFFVRVVFITSSQRDKNASDGETDNLWCWISWSIGFEILMTTCEGFYKRIVSATRSSSPLAEIQNYIFERVVEVLGTAWTACRMLCGRRRKLQNMCIQTSIERSFKNVWQQASGVWNH